MKLEACGLRPGLALQHEAIAPYIIAFRRMRAIRWNGGAGDVSRLLVETRQELRELNTRFHQALDETMRLQEDNRRLRIEQALQDGSGPAASRRGPGARRTGRGRPPRLSTS